jgi:hypothetical protein
MTLKQENRLLDVIDQEAGHRLFVKFEPGRNREAAFERALRSSTTPVLRNVG